MKKMMMLAAVAATLVSCGGGGGGRPTFGDNEYPVVTAGTSSADMQTTYPASIKGVQDVEIRPKVSGFLTQINVKEGQAVSAGQTLFVIDNETYQAQVRQAQAAVNTAQQQVNTAKLTYENSQMLHQNKVIGDYELQTSKNSYEAALAQLAQAQAAVGCGGHAAFQEGCVGECIERTDHGSQYFVDGRLFLRHREGSHGDFEARFEQHSRREAATG